MSRLTKRFLAFYWLSSPALAFTQGQAQTVNLRTAGLYDPQKRVKTLSLASGTLPAGCSISGTSVVYDGVGAAASSSFTLTASDGTTTNTSSGGTATVQATQANQPPAWTVPENYQLPGFTTAGGTVDLTQYANDPEGDPMVFTRTGGTAPGGVVVSESGVLTIPAGLTASTYTVTVDLAQAVGTAEQDWIDRSTGAGVVWAHDFRNVAEITNHLLPVSGGGMGHVGKSPDQVDAGITGAGSKAMRYVALGARTMATFPTALPATTEQTLVIDDATNWPTSDFYVQLMRSTVDQDQSQNLYYCRTRVGTTLYLTWVPYSGQPASTAQLQFPAGSLIGGQNFASWRRPFSALNAAYTGTGVRDINNAGTTYRDLLRPFGYIWGYGYYGHPDYQAANGGNFTYSADGNTRSQIWDGSEFYIQFRVKIDPRFWGLNTYPSPAAYTGQKWSRKIWLLQQEITCEQQIMCNIGPSNRWAIPQTAPNPLKLQKERGPTILTGSSFQPGSQWEATAIDGSSTMVPGDAWEYTDNEWITFLLRIIPGKHGQANTFIELKASRPSDANYPNYTTVFSTSHTIPFETVGEYGVTTAPGYSSFWPTGYLNAELGNIVPQASYYVDWTQIIFSKQPIPAPAVGA